MTISRDGLGILAAATIAALSTGCVRGPDVAASGLALKRVVLYRNGVGYFERAGQIDEDKVTFRVRKDRVGDFLATLAVMETGGSSVRSASFPVHLASDDEAEAPPEPSPDTRESGLPRPPPRPKEKPAKEDRLETVTLTLDGESHDLIVGYVAETPVWRPSYRLVIAGKGAAKAAPGSAAEIAGTADLQAWGIVQNLSGEDWEGVTLSLVAGAPLAFQATLEQPVIPVRPTVTDQGEVIYSVPTGLTTLSEAPMPPPPPPAAEPVDASGEMDRDEGQAEEEKPMERSFARGGMVPRSPAPGSMMRRFPSADETVAQKFDGPSAPRNVSALAAVAMDAGTTRYDLPFTVDVPDESATMVLLLATKVPGEAVFLFAPDGGVPDSASHPFRVARFRNATRGLLERGPIAVFEQGAFLGQGMVDPLPPGATATVPFALERSLAVEQTRTENQEGARLAKIEAGQIEIERDWVTHTKYAVKNGGEEDARTLVKHPRSPGSRLHEPPKGTEDNLGTGSALVPIDVPKHGTAVLDVDERRAFRVPVDLMTPLADEAVKGYLTDPRADAAVTKPLRAAWDQRAKVRELVDELDKLRAERAELESQSQELRSNLKAIEKNTAADDLRRDLTARLAQSSSRLDEITKRSIVLEMQQNEASIRLRDLLAPIRMLAPLAPAKP